MGWASGSELYTRVIGATYHTVPDLDARTTLHKMLIEAFEEHDWDTQNECLGIDPAFDYALQELHPDWEDWDEEA
jgi:hypothetical protein